MIGAIWEALTGPTPGVHGRGDTADPPARRAGPGRGAAERGHSDVGPADYDPLSTATRGSPTLTIEVTETIGCTPDELLEFVMDPEQYALVDSKIRLVRWVRRDGNLCEFGFRSSLAGLPGPPTVSQMRLTPGERIDIRLAPPPANRFTRLASDFDATFVCTPVEGGTRLVRTLNFSFRPALRWLAEPLLRRRLNDDVREEVRLAKTYLERPRLRPAHVDDIPAAATIWHAGWREVHLGHLPAEIHEHRRLTDFSHRFAEDLGAFTVATLDGIVVGVVKVRDDEIEQLYVTGRARGTGVADRLLTHGEQVISARFDRAWLAVIAPNTRARRFYERNGWHDTGPFIHHAPAGQATVAVSAHRYEKSLTPPENARTSHPQWTEGSRWSPAPRRRGRRSRRGPGLSAPR